MDSIAYRERLSMARGQNCYNAQPSTGSSTRTNGAADFSGSLLLVNDNFYHQFSDEPVLNTEAQVLRECPIAKTHHTTWARVTGHNGWGRRANAAWALRRELLTARWITILFRADDLSNLGMHHA